MIEVKEIYTIVIDLGDGKEMLYRLNAWSPITENKSEVEKLSIFASEVERISGKRMKIVKFTRENKNE